MTEAPLPLTATLRRSDSAMEADVAGLTVMMDLDAGSYYGLNEVGTFLWARLAEPRTVAALADELPRHFEVEPDEARTATLAFARDLVARGLVVRTDGVPTDG